MILKPLSREDILRVLEWRHLIPETLRTPFMLNENQQLDYYEKVLSNRCSSTKYLGFWINTKFIGSGGIENIINEYRIGELSLIVNPDFRGKGYGRKCVRLIIDQAFNYLNLENIWLECYKCANYQFWEKILNELKDEYNIYTTWLPNRKYFAGKYYDSLYGNIEKR